MATLKINSETKSDKGQEKPELSYFIGRKENGTASVEHSLKFLKRFSIECGGPYL